jgi:hypothetical protein
MSPDYSFSRFVYFDTNIISELVKRKHLWRSLFDFLQRNDLTLGLSGAQAVELSDVIGLRDDVAALMLGVPSACLKPWDTILDEEVRAHPHLRNDSLLLYPINAMLLEPGGIQKFRDFFSSEGLRAVRNDQLNDARQMAAVHARLKDNFPTSKTGKYTLHEADQFAWAMVIQWLASTHNDFLATFREDIESFHPEVFLSIQLLAHVIFHKYYVGQREPASLSDFGDLFHLACIPYCELAVVERDLCSILGQIKRHQDVLKSTVVRNIDFLEDWSWR